jgi:hypothetical protein
MAAACKLALQQTKCSLFQQLVCQMIAAREPYKMELDIYMAAASELCKMELEIYMAAASELYGSLLSKYSRPGW